MMVNVGFICFVASSARPWKAKSCMEINRGVNPHLPFNNIGRIHFIINHIMSDPFMKLHSFVELLLIFCELLVLPFP